MKWIVFWVLFGMEQMPCPENRAGCLVNHVRFINESHSDTFAIRSKAIEFYNKKREESNQRFRIADIYNLFLKTPGLVRIDSIKITY